MCGIVGYIGPKRVVPLILDGLKRLEYRGYDSAGIAVVGDNGKLEIRRAPGKLRNLEESIRTTPLDGLYGIGHTRWATHGRPTEENAHPHRDCTGEIVVVHNGIIENYIELKNQLIKEGHKFLTETDTEIIAHLLEKFSKDSTLEEAVQKAVKVMGGAYALVAVSAKDPNKIVAARLGPPIVVGLGEHEFFVASDIPAILAHTRSVFFLGDGEIAVLTPQGVKLTDFESHAITRPAQHITWDPIMAEKGGFKHFMQKEIFEQPRAVRDTLLGRISQETGKVFLDEMDISEKEFQNFRDVKIVACGTSWHAGLAGKFMIERLAHMPVEVDYGSEFRYRDPILDKHSLIIAISQSGETADTLAAEREARQKGAKDSGDLQRGGRHAHARIERHDLHARRAGNRRRVDESFYRATHGAACSRRCTWGKCAASSAPAASQNLMQELTRIPHKIEQILQRDGEIEDLARVFFRHTDFLYLGPRNPLSDRARRRAEAERNFVHPRRRVSGGRNEARTQRADRRKSSRGDDCHARRIRSCVDDALRKDHFESAGSESARRHRDRRRHRRRSSRARKPPTT